MNVIIFSTTRRRTSKALSDRINEINRKGEVIWTSPYSYLVQKMCLTQAIIPRMLRPVDILQFRDVEIYYYTDNKELLERFGMEEEAAKCYELNKKDRKEVSRESKAITGNAMAPYDYEIDERLTQEEYMTIDGLIAVCKKYDLKINIISDFEEGRR